MPTPPLREPYVTRVDESALTSFCLEALSTTGMSPEDARVTADVLVRTDMRGISTHGTVSLRRYIVLMMNGGIDPAAVPEITDEGPSWALMDARRAVGMVAGRLGMDAAIDKARTTGVGMTTVRHSNHFGAASAYTLQTLDSSMAGIAMSNTDVVMNIPNGRGAMIGNNPLSYSIPASRNAPLVLDIAMSTVAGGKVASFKSQGKTIPNGWLTNGKGHPTTDPDVFLADGALTPFGAHKGYGLAMLVESFAGVLAGAAMTSDIISWAKESSEGCNEGHAFIAIDIKTMMPDGAFEERTDTLIDRMKGAPKAAGCDRTYVPGEMEWESEQESMEYGVPLTRMAVDNLKGLADDTGVPSFM